MLNQVRDCLEKQWQDDNLKEFDMDLMKMFLEDKNHNKRMGQQFQEPVKKVKNDLGAAVAKIQAEQNAAAAIAATFAAEAQNHTQL